MNKDAIAPFLGGGILVNIKVLFDKKENIHYLARVVEKSETEWKNELPGAEELNGLLLARQPEILMKAIDGMPSLYPDGECGKEKQVLSLTDAAAQFTKRFNFCDEKKLQEELYLDSASEILRKRISSFVKGYSTTGAEFAESLRIYDEHECVVLLEHLQDWVMLRNSLAICARLLGQIEDKRNNVSLEDAGFRYIENTRFIQPEMYIIPLKYNTFHSKIAVKDSKQDPLFDSVQNTEKIKTTIPIVGDAYVHYLSQEHKDVAITTKPLATQEYSGIILNKEDAEGRVYYLTVEANNNRRHEDMAKSIVLAFVSAFSNFTGPSGQKKPKGKELGWAYDEYGIFEELDSPRIIAQSLPSSLFYTLLYHPGQRITVCKNCNNAVLSREKGTRQEYCGPSCRVRAVNLRKKDAENA